MDNFCLLRVKTTIHLFTYSPFPFILPFVNFRRVEPKRRCSHHIHQIWAYATKRRLASLLLHFSAWLILQHYAIDTTALCNRVCLEIKWKTASFSWSELKQLFTYSPIHFLEIKSKKWTTFACCELKQLFTYSPIHLLPRRFRRIEPKGCRRVYGRQNWAYVSHMRQKAAGIFVDTVLPHL